jgi:hypothetical protein
MAEPLSPKQRLRVCLGFYPNSFRGYARADPIGIALEPRAIHRISQGIRRSTIPLQSTLHIPMLDSRHGPKNIKII